MESDINRPININNYNSSEGKLCASIKWLITRIYENNDIPDNLQDIFYRDNEGNLQLRDAVIKCLTSGTFYTQAASKILRNNLLVTQSVGAVLRALSSVGIDVREVDGSYVTEASLVYENPLKMNSHLILIDSLMTAHLKSVISIERVVQAISAYTPVERREEPLDCVDALLFWINKICLLVRDDVERNGIALESNNDATIPEMEDLYEDLCDGTCVCVLVSFYHPHDMPLQRIYFNDPMHINDCRFNLGLLKEFCETALPFNPFHFEIDDILYLHESLQPNVNVFLADLFNCFENALVTDDSQSSITYQNQQFGVQSQVGDPPQLVSLTQRRFVPITGIPDLRSQNASAISSSVSGGSKLGRFAHGSSQRDQAISMVSVDSSMTARSGDSLMFPSAKLPLNLGPNTTHFGELSENSNRRMDMHESELNGANITPKIPAAEVKLQMGELRRQFEANKIIQNAANEEKRNQASKDAFFRVMSKSTNDDKSSTQQMSESARENFTSREDLLTAQLHSLQEQINNIKLNPKLSADNGQTAGADANSLPYVSPSSTFPSSNTLTRPFHHSQNMDQTSYAQTNSLYGMSNTPTPGYNNNHLNQFTAHSTGPYMDQQQLPQQSFLGGGHNMSNMPGGFMQSPSSQQNILQYGQQQPNLGGYVPSHSLSPYYPNVPQQPSYFPHPSYQQYQQAQQHMLPSNQTSCQFTPQSSQYYMQPMIQPHLQPHQHQQLFSTGNDVNSPHQKVYSDIGNMYNDLNGGSIISLPAVSPHQQLHQHDLGNEGGTFRLHQPNASTSRLDPPLELNRNLTNWGITYRMGERAPRKSWSKNTFRSENDVSSPVTTIMGHNAERTPESVDGTATNFNGNGNIGKNVTMTNSASMTDGFGITRNGTTNKNYESDSKMSSERRPVSAYIAEDAIVSDSVNPELTAEMQAKRRALLLNQMRRKEKIIAQSEDKEHELSERRQLEQQKLEQAEQRKLERELKRQRLLEDYKRKKMEQDLGDPSLSGGCVSARMSASSTTSLNRGHSQPPIGRPKSQSNMSLSVSRTLQRSGRTHSNVGDNDNCTPRVAVPSTAEPTLKLYAKHQPKSNRTLMMNALQYRVFPGAVTAEQKSRVQCALAQSDSKHFLILFRDHKCQYRGMYTWDQISDTVYKIDGTGPKICREDAMVLMFKYDSGAKLFNRIPTKHLSATIDGFTIDEQFWQKTRIPHS